MSTNLGLQLRVSSEGYLENTNRSMHEFVISSSFCCALTLIVDFSLKMEKKKYDK
jgi:hypothetical protein